jgi:Protein of unknown function (DUF2809)
MGKEYQRQRWIYVLGGLLVIGLGLGSRSGQVPLSDFMAKYAGDALWALLVFLGFGFLFPSRSTLYVAGLAAVFSILIELSQLYHAPWIDALRRNRLGGLILGDTFAWGDIAAYLVGIALGVAAEVLHRGTGSLACPHEGPSVTDL